MLQFNFFVFLQLKSLDKNNNKFIGGTLSNKTSIFLIYNQIERSAL